MSRKKLAGALVLALATTALGPTAQAAEEAAPFLQKSWSHDGIFGTFDRAAAQRGAGLHGRRRQ